MKTRPHSNQNYSNTGIEYENPIRVSNGINHLIGFVFLVLNKIRHKFQGYTSTRGFSSSLLDKAITHDLNVVVRWYDYLKKYDATAEVFKGKRILELGPGADLGVGLLLLAEGASSYSAMDVHNLVETTPPELYNHLFDHLVKSGVDEVLIEELKSQLVLTNMGQNDKLNYRVTKNFDLSVFPEKSFDLIVSNAAFQQFDDPVKSISEFSKLVSKGAKFVALIDLKTHTRFIRGRDPLNIYRYGNKIFELLRFKGAPNRIRSYEYENALKLNGWENITTFPRIQLQKEYVEKIKHTLNSKFRADKNQMQNLTVVICATKK